MTARSQQRPKKASWSEHGLVWFEAALACILHGDGPLVKLPREVVERGPCSFVGSGQYKVEERKIPLIPEVIRSVGSDSQKPYAPELFVSGNE